MNFTEADKDDILEAIPFALEFDYAEGEDSLEFEFESGAVLTFESDDNVNVNLCYSRDDKCVSLSIDETMTPESILEEIIERIGG